MRWAVWCGRLNPLDYAVLLTDGLVGSRRVSTRVCAATAEATLYSSVSVGVRYGQDRIDHRHQSFQSASVSSQCHSLKDIAERV
jgi:hypothetical protein